MRHFMAGFARRRAPYFCTKLLKIFTLSLPCAIILNMKTLLAALAGAAVLSATMCGGMPAAEKTEYPPYGQEHTCAVYTSEEVSEYGLGESGAIFTDGQTEYPEFVTRLEIGQITCYAVQGDRFAFAGGEDGRYIYIYSGGTRPATPEEGADGELVYTYEGGIMENATADGVFAYRNGSAVTAMQFDGDDLLFTDEATDTIQRYSGGTVTSSAGTLPPANSSVDYTAENLYLYINEGSLHVLNKSDNSVTTVADGVFSSLQLGEDGVYAIMDGGLCLIERGEEQIVDITPLEFVYTDESHSQSIVIGDTAELLAQLQPATRIVNVPAAQYVTEIDLTDLGGQYFKVGEEGTFRTETDGKALLLCTTGNADIIAMGDKAYITKSVGASSELEHTAAPFASARLNYSSGLYSVPYMCTATQIIQLDMDSRLTVENQITAAGAQGTLTNDFCLVSYTAEDGTEYRGYVATSFLTAYDFSGEDGEFGEITPPEDYSEDNAIITVVLIIIIVVLVIAGVAFLAYSSGAGKRKSREPKDTDGEDKS